MVPHLRRWRWDALLVVAVLWIGHLLDHVARYGNGPRVNLRELRLELVDFVGPPDPAHVVG